MIRKLLELLDSEKDCVVAFNPGQWVHYLRCSDNTQCLTNTSVTC